MLTPKQAWIKECRWCSNCPPGRCLTTVCKLSPVFIFPSTLQRIKAHCLNCAAQDTHETKPQAVKTCNGHLLRENNNTDRWMSDEGERGICFLHPFRFGKNPTYKKRPLTPEERERRAAPLKKWRSKQAPGTQNGT